LGLNQFSVFFIITLIATLLSLGLSLYAWRQRASRGALSFSMLMLAVTLWTGAIGAGMVAPTIGRAYLWAIIRMAGVIATPVIWLNFAFHFSQKERWSRLLPAILTGLLPVVSFALMATNESHHLFLKEIQWEREGPFLIDAIWDLGPWFPVHLIYSYALILIGDYFILREAYQLVHQFRGQAVALFLGTLFPLVVNLAFTFHFIPGLTVNYDPLGFVFSGMAFAGAILQFRLFDLAPIARRFLVDEMKDGLVVIDQKGRLVDINPAAQVIFNLHPETDIGKASTEFVLGFDLNSLVQNASQNKLIEFERHGKVYEVRATSLVMKKQPVGSLVICHEITQRKTMEEQLRQLSRSDSLTNVYNRRYFFQYTEVELARAYRYKRDLALILFDCDYFKEINDHYGHLSGDQVLINLAQLCQDNLRSSDRIARYGGEEFIILSPESDAATASKFAERLNTIIANTEFMTKKGVVKLTVSTGIVTLGSEVDISAETLVDRADQALYQSKKNGRNQVTFWKPAD